MYPFSYVLPVNIQVCLCSANQLKQEITKIIILILDCVPRDAKRGWNSKPLPVAVPCGYSLRCQMISKPQKVINISEICRTAQLMCGTKMMNNFWNTLERTIWYGKKKRKNEPTFQSIDGELFKFLQSDIFWWWYRIQTQTMWIQFIACVPHSQLPPPNPTTGCDFHDLKIQIAINERLLQIIACWSKLRMKVNLYFPPFSYPEARIRFTMSANPLRPVGSPESRSGAAAPQGSIFMQRKRKDSVCPNFPFLLFLHLVG